MVLSETSQLMLSGSSGLLEEIRDAIRRGLSSLEAPTPMLLSVWAAKNFYLSAESSQVEGSFRAWPFQTGILDLMGHDEVESVGVRKSARVGYTKMLLAAVGFFAEHKRRNQVIYQPTDEDSDEFVKTEIDTMLRDVPVMARIFPAAMRRHKDNTLRQKKFLGSMLHLRGGKAAKNYRRITVSVVHMDEIDAFDNNVEKEGSPPKLSKKRLEGATYPKQICGTTPKLKGFSLIDEMEAEAEAFFQYHIPCPHCGEEHRLQWGGREERFGMKWVIDGATITASQLCPHCGSLYSQAEYLGVWQRGRWKTADGLWIDAGCIFRDAEGNERPAPRHAAVHVWTAYSPQATWEDIVREFLAAYAKLKTGDTALMQTFCNTTLGESYVEAADKADEHALMRRAEDYPVRVVPQGGLVLVAGVDVQDNRFEVVVWAIGVGEEMWTVDYAVIPANPADERDWDEKLDAYLQTSFPHANGSRLAIESAAVDTGGHFTHQAYNFARTRERRRIFAIKGDSQPGKPVAGRSSAQDVNFRGRVLKRGVKLWMVGTDTAKDLLYGRLMVTQPGPGYVHMSKHLPIEFFHGLTAESRVLAKTSTGSVHRWVNVARKRNEPLDCTVYAIFCTHRLGLHTYTDRMWQRLSSAILPDLFDVIDVDPLPAPAVRQAALPMAGQTSKRPPPSAPTKSLASDEWSARL